MSNEAAAQEAKVAPIVGNDVVIEMDVERHDPVAINTKWGAVAVFGHENVSKKDLQLFQLCLASDAFVDFDHGVRAIVLRTDGRPHKDGKPMLATCDLDGGVIIINLMKTVSDAIENCIDHPKFCVLAVAHQSLMESVLHEAHHISGLSWDLEMRKKLEADGDEFWATMEKGAEDFSMAELVQLAKVADIEPGHIAESPFLANQLMECIADDTSDFAEAQRHLLENNLLFYQEAGESEKAVMIHTFKDFMCYMSGDDIDDPEWATPTITGAAAASPTLLSQTVEPEVTQIPFNADDRSPEAEAFIAKIPLETKCQYLDSCVFTLTGQSSGVNQNPAKLAEYLETASDGPVVEPEVIIDTGDGEPILAEPVVVNTVVPGVGQVVVKAAPLPAGLEAQLKNAAPVVTNTAPAPDAPVVMGDAGTDAFVNPDDIPDDISGSGHFDGEEFADFCSEGPAGAPAPTAEAVAAVGGTVVAPAVVGIPPATEFKKYGTVGVERTEIAEDCPAPAGVHPITGFTQDQTSAIAFGVFNKIFDHIFSVCGRAAGYPRSAEDITANIGDQAMTDGGPACQIANCFLRPIQLTEDERKVIVRCSCRGADGKWQPAVNLMENGGILRGFTAPKPGIPMYKIAINNADGHETLRLVMPQNPNKPGSKRALQAQGGTKIMYVIDGIDKEEGSTKSNFLFKRVNDVWAEC